VLFVVAVVAILSPLRVDATSLTTHFPVMIGFCMLIVLAWPGGRLSRWHGALFLSGFVGYMAFLILPVL
jgi:cation:H+ antiporter